MNHFLVRQNGFHGSIITCILFLAGYNGSYRSINSPFPNDKFWTLPYLKTVDDNFRFEENGQKGRKHYGKRRNCSLQAISPFLTVFSKDLNCRHVKARDCQGRGLSYRCMREG